MKKTLRRLKNRIISGLAAGILILSPVMMPVTAYADEISETVQTESDLTEGEETDTPEESSEALAEDENIAEEGTENDGTSSEDAGESENDEDSSEESEESTSEEGSEQTSEEDSENPEDEEPTSEEESAEDKEDVSPEDGSEELPDEEDSTEEGTATGDVVVPENGGDNELHTVLSETKDAVELSVLTTLGDSSVEINPVDVEAEEEGLEVITGYEITGKSEDSSYDASADSEDTKEESDEEQADEEETKEESSSQAKHALSKQVTADGANLRETKSSDISKEDTTEADSEEDSKNKSSKDTESEDDSEDKDSKDTEEADSEVTDSEDDADSEDTDETDTSDNTDASGGNEEEVLLVTAEPTEELQLQPKEKISLYSVEDNKIKDIIIEDISEETEPCEIDGDVTGIALVKDTGYRHLNIELFPNEEDEEKETIIILDGMMPKDATASAKEVEGTVFDAESINDDIVNNENTSAENIENDENDALIRRVSLAAFDITIYDENNEYQPGEERPVNVTIQDERICSDENISVWHIRNDGTREEILNFVKENGLISFSATGFSVYEIVKKDINPQGFGWKIITDFSDFVSHCSEDDGGLYMGNSGGFYFKNTTTIVTGTRECIEKTKMGSQGGTDITTAISLGAVPYYFEPVSGTTNQFYAYCYGENNVKLYVKNKNNNSLSLSDQSSDKTAFIIKEEGNNKFSVKEASGNKYYWNMQGNAAGKGFAAFEQNNDGSKIQFLYYDPSAKDPYELDGVSFGLMSNFSDNVGYALMADMNQNAVEMPAVAVRHENNRKVVYVSEECEITIWTFHNTTEDNYTLSADVNGVTKYLQNNNNVLTMVDSQSEATSFKVIGNDKGQFSLSDGGYSIFYDSANKKFSIESTIADSKWMNFVKFSDVEDDEVITYAAHKVGVSDPSITTGSKVIVYARVWNEHDKVYEFYAIDHDGTLYPCFERGDDIMWVGDKINTLLWDFTEYTYDDGTPNYYYELQNEYSKKYLSPKIEEGQILSDNEIGINMPGRRDGEYYSSILAWDDPYYSYAGLKADDVAKKIVSCPKAQADDFYFAVMDTIIPELTPVETIDNHDYGITMKMVDYKATTKDYQSQLLGDMTKWEDHKLEPKTGILSTNLVADPNNPDIKYPTITAKGTSLSGMFSDAVEVNHLFIDSTYEASGYFEFDSCQNFATLVKDDGTIGTDFTVYKELGTSDASPKTTLKHGQFFPYNKITPGFYSANNPENLYNSHANTDDASEGLLPEDDPRKYEKLHSIPSPNYHNGMELEASFIQSATGKDNWGHDIIFEFTGDDDFWFYVDDDLVIDLGGIHSALSGNVNFSTGKVVVNGVETNLKQVFHDNYKARKPGASEEEITNYLDNIFAPGENIFKDYSSHTMRIFYMERGAGASNLHMRFNLSYVTPGNVLMSKKVTEGEGDEKKETDKVDFNLVEFPYQIWYKEESSGQIRRLDNANAFIGVTYQNSTQKVEYKSSYTPPNGTPIPDVYFLNPGKVAEIHFPSKAIEYKIIECGVNYEVYDHVYINDVENSGETIGSTKRKNYESAWISVEERPTIAFENHIDPAALRTISIRKELLDENGNEISAADDKTTFSFRLSLSNGAEEETNLANMVRYNVKSPGGKLCVWDVNQWLTQQQGFKETNYGTLDPEEGDTPEIIAEKEALKDAVTFETSMYGSISRIPAGYTVEVPNLPVGTRFELDERENEIPLGYSLIEYERKEGTYTPSEDGDTNEGWIRYNESPSMDVRNKRGWELEAEKQWSDKKYIDNRDPIFTAVYIGDELVADSVKQINYPNTSVRYFFESLQSGKTFADYKIFEVELQGAVFDADGNLVSYTGVTRINDGGLISIRGKSKTSTEMSPFWYAVNYEYGRTKSTADGYDEAEDDPNGNIRKDIISNTRSGGIVMTLYKMGTREPLSNGIFIFERKDPATGNYIEEGTYTSDNHGRITILYEYEVGVEYRLTEKVSPKNYIGLPEPVTFTIDTDENITLSGNTDEWRSWHKPSEQSDRLVAYIDVFNKPYTLEVYKFDGQKTSADGSLKAAHFELYRGVEGFGGIVKDYTPIPGYEDLETDENGRIPSIDNELVSGRYFLVEKTPPEGYIGLDGDVVFDISDLGVISLVNTPKGSNVTLTTSTEGDTYRYLLNIPNKRDGSDVMLKINKTVTGVFGSRAKEFEFKFETKNGDTTEYSYSKKDAANHLTANQTIKHGDTFTLTHGEEIVITMPMNTEVTITESDYGSDGYVTTVSVDQAAAESARSKHLKVADDTELSFTNTRDGLVPTGVWMPVGSLIILSIITIAGICITIIRQRRLAGEIE